MKYINKSFKVVDLSELEDVISSYFKLPNHCLAYEQEYDEGGYYLEKADKQYEPEEFPEDYFIADYLCILARNGVIEEGEYLIRS